MDRSIDLHKLVDLLKLKDGSGRDMKLYDFQWDILSSKARVVVVAGNTRMGKSLMAGILGVAYLLIPDTRSWIVAPSYDLGEKEFRYIFNFWMENLGLKDAVLSYHYDTRSGNMDIKTAFGSSAQVKSADNPISLLGEEVDYLILSEGANLPDSIWERYLRGRIINRNGRVFIPSTPAGNGGFVHRFWERGLNPNQNEVKSFQHSCYDCPHIKAEEIADAKDNLSEEAFNEQWLGKFVQYKGLVYKEWDINKHVVNDFEIPKFWERYRAIDYGVSNPFCCIWCSVAPDGTVYVYDEHYHSNMTIKDHSNIIHRKTGKDRIILTYIDPSAGIKLDLTQNGIPCCDAENDIPTGIARVHQYLAVDKLTQQPRLKVFRSCVNTVREFGSYCYDEQRAGKNLNEKPIKKGDHCLHGDTKIFTTNGEIAIKDLVDKEFYVYSYDVYKHRICVKKARNCRKTIENTRVVKVTYDDGNSIITTPEHLIMKRNEEWCRADELKEKDSIMPFYHVIDSHGHMVVRLNNGERMFAHRLVYNDVFGEVMDTWTNNVHHVDEDKLNNNPDNLKMVTRSQHASIHRNGKTISEKALISLRNTMQKLRLNEEYAKRIKLHCAAIRPLTIEWHGSKEGLEWHRKHGIECWNKQKENRIFKICQWCGFVYGTYKSREKWSKFCSIKCKTADLRKRYKELNKVNHKVEKVEECGFADTYNFEVDGTHCFVANGIIVHNSQDCVRYFLMSRPAFSGQYINNYAPEGSLEWWLNKTDTNKYKDAFIGNN